jgi:hypothetical protein
MKSRIVARHATLTENSFTRLFVASIAGRMGKPAFSRSKYADPEVLLTSKKAVIVPKDKHVSPKVGLLPSRGIE